MPNPAPTREELPEAGGTSVTYKAADKLKGKRALITGGDSGIGAASALLFAKEGAAAVTIVYLPDEEKDAQDTKSQLEKEGGTCYLFSADLVKKENCQKAVDFAVDKMGGIDILFNNAACKSQPHTSDVVPTNPFYSVTNPRSPNGCRKY